MQLTRRDEQHVVAADEVARGRQAQAVQVVVAAGVLLDVDVALRDVRLGLVVVVVADEIPDGVVREQLLELLVKLGGEGLVVADDERRPVERGRSTWAIVKVLPEPVTPMRVWNFLP